MSGMRPKNQSARDQLLMGLARRPRASASELAEPLGVSVPTLHRLLAEVAGHVVVNGKARRTRYALRRPLRGQAAELPLYEVDAAGRAEPLASLALVHPEGTRMALEGSGWPVPEASRDGGWPGLPYPLDDMRPQGYMGRQFARAEHRQLALPAEPQAWSDAEIVFAPSQRGADLSGNLILGDPAYERWQAAKLAAPEPLRGAGVGRAYAALAEQALAAGVVGSSAAGEFPKFAALRELAGSKTAHVLVKFSGADGSAAVRRWSDLLVCEHLALECAATLPAVHSARSRIVTHAGNLSFRAEQNTLRMAPAYDMLPMLYAPLPGGEVAHRTFEPRLPLPAQREVWRAACTAAVLFWSRAAEDARISDAFRKTCNANALRLQELAAHA